MLLIYFTGITYVCILSDLLELDDEKGFYLLSIIHLKQLR